MTSPDITIQTMSHLLVFVRNALRHRRTSTPHTKTQQRYCDFVIYANYSAFLCDEADVFSTFSRSCLDIHSTFSRYLPDECRVDYISFLYNVLRLTCSEIMLCSSSIGIRSCFMVSRKRTVTQLSTSVSWSTVMQNGVPMAS